MKNLVKLVFLAAFLFGCVQTGFSRGDKVIPQIVNGPGWITKIDLTNISSETPIRNMRLVFFRSNGTRWSLPTNLGTGSEYTLSLDRRATIRVETTGGGSTVENGYAVIYDEETGNSTYSEDFVLGISPFYVYSVGNEIVDTVTVTAPEPTAAANLPMEMNFTRQTYSGLVIVNRASVLNSITVDLYDERGSLFKTRQMELAGGEQFAGFLDDSRLFASDFQGRQNFKGMAQITSRYAVAILALLQTQAGAGQQFSTLAAVDRESLRRNSYMVALQFPDPNNPFLPLDLDRFTVDYSRTKGAAQDTETYSWDLVYQYDGIDPRNREILAADYNNAAIATIGVRDGPQFDTLSLPYLKGLTYTTGGIIDLGPRSSVLSEPGYTFAVRTDLGNYAKVRILRIIDTTIDGNSNYRDLVLEVEIYR